MKSGISFFNTTALRKDLTRFAPAWVIYGVLQLLFLMGSGTGIWSSQYLVASIPTMAVMNFFYALLCAQLLFGDLFSSRMCNALHAMPMRREGWLLTHLTAGGLFSLMPNATITLLAMAFGQSWQIPLLWLAAMSLQFLFFFGVAVLSMFLTGNRFAMCLVYIILNGFILIVFWLIHSIYEPLLYGITFDYAPFLLLCPVVQMVTFEYIDIDYDMLMNGEVTYFFWQTTDGWLYLAICAGLGLVCIALALLCYRKRHLETAGDFVAVKPLGPVFLVLYTLCGGACCHGFFTVMLGAEGVIFLVVGLTIGFFTGLMLLERRVRVFRKKTFLGFGIVVAVMLLSVVLVRIDPAGITRWVPKMDQVKGVRISTDIDYYNDEKADLSDPEIIAEAILVHQHGVDHPEEGTNGKRDVRVKLQYTLSSGIVRERYYNIDVDTEAGRTLEKCVSRPEIVLAELYAEDLADRLVSIEVSDPQVVISDKAQRDSLLAAVIADCEAGNMAQSWAFNEDANYHNWLNFLFIRENGGHSYMDVRITENAQNTRAWLDQHGIKPEKSE